ncbi:MAG: hypothetical protein JWP51_981 [Bradyrhizobium sp.]|jgi:hypothetical protein|nr:hypothetical protein [Bradyrhizobium sp.]
MHAEQHLAVAKLVRSKASKYDGADRERYITKSNSLVVCVRLSAADRGGISLEGFNWKSLTPDWDVLDKQIARLRPPLLESPSIIPDV